MRESFLIVFLFILISNVYCQDGFYVVQTNKDPRVANTCWKLLGDEYCTEEQAVNNLSFRTNTNLQLIEHCY